MRRPRYVIKSHNHGGLFYRAGPNPHWTPDITEATGFQFVTLAIRAIVGECGLSLDVCTIERDNDEVEVEQ